MAENRKPEPHARGEFKKEEKKSALAYRLESEGGPSVSRPVGILVGGLMGAVGGLAFMGWETASLAWFGVQLPDGGSFRLALGVYMVIGGLIGAAVGGSGLWGPRWSMGTAVMWVAWLSSGFMAGELASSGGPPWMGTLIVLAIGFIMASVAGRIPFPASVHAGAATLTFVTLAIALPINLHVLPAPGDAVALVIDAIALLFGLFIGGMVGSITTEEGTPLVPLTLGAAVGWGIAFPVMFQSHVVPESSAEGPPLVLVAIDGFRADELTAAGYTRNVTPALDALGERGFVYTSVQATSPWSIPSLGTILTGRMPYEHGAANHNGSTPLQSPLRPDVTTLTDWLAHHGYVNIGVTADPWLQGYRIDWGFDVWDDKPEAGAVPVGVRPIQALGLRLWPYHRRAGELTEAAVALLEQTRGKRGWFLFVNYRDAASPFTWERADLDVVGKTMRPFPADDLDAALHFVDRHLGRLLSELPDDAVIAVVGTHGVQVREVRERNWAAPQHARSGHSLFQEVLRVPILLEGGSIAVGTSDRPVSMVDLVPTLVEAIGLPLPKQLDGEPLPEALGRPYEEPEKGPRALISQCMRYGIEQQAVRLGDDKLIAVGPHKAVRYDLATDPGELVAGREADKDQLKRKLQALLPPNGAGVHVLPPAPVSAEFGALGTRLIK